MTHKVIKTKEDYQKALSRIDALMDALPNTPEGDELELLVTLVELYEDKKYQIGMPDAIEAIKFRMEQLDLNQQALVPFVGSKSKVSEILNKKRPLSLSMMRALHKGLGIPAELLLQEQGQAFPEEVPEIEWRLFPIYEMVQEGWIQTGKDIEGNEEEIMREYIEEAGGMNRFSQFLFRQSKSLWQSLRTDKYALMAWCLRVLVLSRKHPLENKNKPGSIDLSDLSKLSYFDNGPLLAEEYLEKHGIQFFVVFHLKKTYLDGAVMILEDETPIVALTLRYDRIDNFWFCLLHELAHLTKHLSKNTTNIIIDEFEQHQLSIRGQDKKEKEADKIAQNALIPKKNWEKVNLEAKDLSKQVICLADELKIHPAIVAGRIRYELNNYRILSQFVGSKKVGKLFSSISHR
jgi:HTH-type transcriptional regulator/antitoxin HigA